MLEGYKITFESLELDYFFSDLSTYIINLYYISRIRQYSDFSKIDFSTDRSQWSEVMTNLMEAVPSAIGKPERDDLYVVQRRHNGSTELLQFLFYIKRNGSVRTMFRREKGFYQKLQQNIQDRQTRIREWSTASVELLNVCFETTVSSSETSYKDTLVWLETNHTKFAMSEPMCLNDWRLITRECKPSAINGAQWQPFDYSKCTKYQPAVKEMETTCPNGFKILDQNLCYVIYKDRKTFDEAEEICHNKSSFLMDLESLRKTKLLSELDNIFNFTELPLRYGSLKGQVYRGKQQICISPIMNYSGLHKNNSNFHCIAVNRMNKILQYNIVDCEPTRRLAFSCIHQPFTLLTSFMFSKSWHKFTKKHTCYYVDHKKKTWEEAKESCQAFPTKSTLLQSIRNLNDYSLFKTLLRTLRPVLKGTSWWMNLFQEEDIIKWSSTLDESVTFVDWERHTNFSMNSSGGVLTLESETHSNIAWSLKEPLSNERSICEMQTCADTRKFKQ
ncbi:hypothetical protein HNY73_022066 [Argiope bruennichi]|uniref:C-type lectin domain-containing protein n=2 Tax=Argiope bruennichi TaxID=94029 RepID=A0A8T0E134_ARGBR|nr:hypothetical protein HNY73_022066 [Argiope bruennichi]